MSKMLDIGAEAIASTYRVPDYTPVPLTGGSYMPGTDRRTGYQGRMSGLELKTKIPKDAANHQKRYHPGIMQGINYGFGNAIFEGYGPNKPSSDLSDYVQGLSNLNYGKCCSYH